VRELLARVESVLRRSAERSQGPSTVPLPGGEIDLLHEEVRWHDGDRAPLTGLEASLLRYLASFPGRFLSRDELLQQVWRVDPKKVRTRSLDMTIARLRKKLRDEEILVTVRGRGYRLNPAPR
jgi:two-component system, OmpR family, alkaline phosphatase synthesis response regulator PhoP